MLNPILRGIKSNQEWCFLKALNCDFEVSDVFLSAFPCNSHTWGEGDKKEEVEELEEVEIEEKEEEVQEEEENDNVNEYNFVSFSQKDLAQTPILLGS